METSLLIGNGLNRSLKHSISWSDLLKDIADEYHVPYNGSISMPLEFESIVNQYLDTLSYPTDSVYLEIKKKIAEKMSYTKLPQNAIHCELASLPLHSLMTSNYDNLLEYAFDPDYSYKGSKNKKYLFDKTSTQNGIDFYHIHGHSDSPKTICLGYEHYMGVVEKMRSNINSPDKNGTKMKKILNALLEPEKQRKTWDERFYTDNIGIIGLGLSESEVDLWWLITHRAYLYYSNYFGIRKVLKNRIIYYDMLDESKPEELKQKKKIHYMLKNSHVEVRTLVKGIDCDNHEDAYRIIIQRIRNGELSEPV